MATTKRLSATITIGGAVSSTLKSAFGEVKGKLGEVGKTVTDLTRRQKLLGKAIQEFGRAGKDVDGLRNSYARLTTQIDRARAAQAKLQRATDFKEKAVKIGGALKGAAVRAGATGVGIGAVLYGGVRHAVERENVVNIIRNSGVSKEDGDAMVNAAAGSKQFGVSITKATETVSELRTALGDAHHAIEALPTALKAISGLQMYDRLHHTDLASGDSAYQLAKVSEERGGATDPEAMRAKYNWAFKALTGSNGKVSVNDLLTSVRSGKGAVQAMSDEAFFGDTFLQQSMGADRYGTSSSTLVNAWIGGHQKNTAFQHMLDMGLLNKSGVKFDKNGNVNKVNPDALVDAQTFLKDPQTWVDKHLMPLAKSRGVDASDPAQVMSFVNAITSNPNAANMLLSRMRFDSNIWKDRRNVGQANDAEQSDRANQQSTAGKEENIRARYEDAQSRVGNVLLPAFATAMEKTADALEQVNKFAEENPRLMKAVVIGLGGLAAGLVAVAPLLLTASAIIGTIATIKLARAASEVDRMVAAMNGVEGAAAGAAGGLSKVLGMAARIAGIAGAVVAVANTTTDQEDDELKNGDAKWKALRAKYPQATVDAARKKYQPWYQFGSGYADENQDWINQYQKDQAKVPPAAAQKGTPMAAPVTNNNTFHITATPGMDTNDIANAVVKKLNQQQAKQSRSVMFDGASQ